MIKHILVPTDGSDQAQLGVHFAVAFAQKRGATLHGLHVIDIKLLEGPFLRDVSASLGTAPYANYQGNMSLLLEERGKVALEAFRKTCEEAGVPCDTAQVAGMVPRSILEKSELCDLIILGRSGEHAQWLDGLLGSTTEAVARRASRPVLVTSRANPGNSLFIVAYDGTSYSRQALKFAASFAADWSAPLHTLVVANKERGNTLLDEARKYFAPHALDVSYIRQEGDAGEAIVAYAEERQADLLIMGAYGHTKVRELVLGSTTAYVLNHASFPLLLAR